MDAHFELVQADPDWASPDQLIPDNQRPWYSSLWSRISLATATLEAGATTIVSFTFPGPETGVRIGSWYNVTVSSGCYTGPLVQAETSLADFGNQVNVHGHVALPVQGALPQVEFVAATADEDVPAGAGPVDGSLLVDAAIYRTPVLAGNPALITTSSVFSLIEIHFSDEFRSSAGVTVLGGGLLDPAFPQCGVPLPTAVYAVYTDLSHHYPGLTFNPGLQQASLRSHCGLGAPAGEGGAGCTRINVDFASLYTSRQSVPGVLLGPYYYQLSTRAEGACPCLLGRIMMGYNTAGEWTVDLRLAQAAKTFDAAATLAAWNDAASRGNDTAFVAHQWLRLLAPEHPTPSSVPFAAVLPKQRGCPGFIDPCPRGTVGCLCRDTSPLCDGDLGTILCTDRRCVDSRIPTPLPPTPYPIDFLNQDCNNDQLLVCTTACEPRPLKTCACDNLLGTVDFVCLEEEEGGGGTTAAGAIGTTLVVVGALVSAAVVGVGGTLLYRRRQSARGGKAEATTAPVATSRKHSQARLGRSSSRAVSRTALHHTATGPTTSFASSAASVPGAPPLTCAVCAAVYLTAADLALHQEKRSHFAPSSSPAHSFDSFPMSPLSSTGSSSAYSYSASSTQGTYPTPQHGYW